MEHQLLEDATRYVWGNFISAHAALVKGHGDLRDRVKEAYLAIGPVSPKDVPAQFRDELAWILENKTARSGQLDRMEDAEVEEIALRISRFYEGLNKHVERVDG